jgi:murein DD-endopeptidase MepM/ murein hydrolase activator NlpD
MLHRPPLVTIPWVVENVPGAPGMAGGDHLHYAMMVHGEFVNPV